MSNSSSVKLRGNTAYTFGNKQFTNNQGGRSGNNRGGYAGTKIPPYVLD